MTDSTGRVGVRCERINRNESCCDPMEKMDVFDGHSNAIGTIRQRKPSE